MTTSDTRTSAAAILRAAADLIESQPGIPVPGTDISFYLHGPDAAPTMAAIAEALPCPWQASINRSSSGEYEWLDLHSGPELLAGGGTRVRITAKAAHVCELAGTQTRTVTVWRPAGVLAGLVGTNPLGAVA